MGIANEVKNKNKKINNENNAKHTKAGGGGNTTLFAGPTGGVAAEDNSRSSRSGSAEGDVLRVRLTLGSSKRSASELSDN
jgi:hypothetical protein